MSRVEILEDDGFVEGESSSSMGGLEFVALGLAEGRERRVESASPIVKLR